MEGSGDTIQAAFGRAVRTLRLAGGLSQQRLAERTGLHRTYVGGVERGERNLCLANIDRLARALEVTLPRLMEVVEQSRDEPESSQAPSSAAGGRSAR